jgi:RNA polymerase sigma-70 factor (ECF subfamily)
MRPDDSFPSPQLGLALHLRLCADDPVATADLCRAYLVPLTAWLEAKGPRCDSHLAQTAVGEALMTYAQRPRAYDPARGDLAAYLRMAARGDLLNLLRKERRHHRDRISLAAVEDGEDSGNLSGREPEPLAHLEQGEQADAGRAVVRAVAERCSEEEKRVLDLLVAGERSTAVFAAGLGKEHLPATEQEREVKRVKDRLIKRLEREGQKHG